MPSLPYKPVCTNLLASAESRDLSLQHSAAVTPVMMTANRDTNPNALPKPGQGTYMQCVAISGTNVYYSGYHHTLSAIIRTK
jgi:hypothetical protein